MFSHDLLHAWHALRRAPGFTAVALVTLTIGLGVNTAMFSVLRAVVLRPLPYRDPDRLAMVWQTQERVSDQPQVRPRRRTPLVQALARWREDSRSFESLAGYSGQYLNLTGGGAAERVVALIVTPNFFPTLGITPARGRNFLPEEEQPAQERSVILSDELWRSRFAADPAILGKALSLDGASYTVVGVLPAGFDPLLPTVSRRFDLYLPLALNEKGKRPPPVRVVGRLRNRVDLPTAQSELEAIAVGLGGDVPPGHRVRGVLINQLTDEVTGDVKPALLALAGAVACVLLIVCANLASMMLARASARQREMGIRAALGAGRWRLARPILAEALLLGIAGGAAGTVLARWIVDLIRALHPGGLPRIEQAAPDAVVFAFGLAVSVIAGLLFGALPALAASRTKLDAVLRQGHRSVGGRGRLRSVLVASEVALALMLATGAGLLMRSYVLLKAIAPGFSGDRVLTMQLWFPERAYSEARRGEFLERALERIRGLPAVESAGAVSSLPLAYEALISTDVEVKGHPRENVNTLGVTPGYFETIGSPLLTGRFLREGDKNAILVNQAFCKRYGLDTARVVGEQIALYGKYRTVVGVVRDVRDLQLDKAAEPEAFMLYTDLGTPWAGLAVRTSSDPKSLAAAIRAEIRALDPNQPVARFQTMEEILSREVARPRFNVTLLGIFAGVAVGLAALGVYGVITYLVSQRRNEIGVRMALGAQRGAVIRYVLARGMIPVAVGMAVGIGGALAATRILRGLLYGVGPTDPATFVLSVLLLAAVTLAACWLPACRATKIDPIEALRYE
jgi:putative ABC transport system permease protein